MNKNTNGSILGKIVYTGTLVTESILMISSGAEDHESDRLLQRNKEGYPFIPATSLIGVIRNYFFKNYKDKYRSTHLDYFWGSDNKSSEDFQSAMIINDLELLNKDCKTFIRDGVAIDNKTGTAKHGKKYDYEVLEPGAQFSFYLEVNLREGYPIEDFEEISKIVIDALINGEIFIGAKTTRGFGRCKLTDVKHKKYFFNNKKDVFEWLTGISEIQVYNNSNNTNNRYIRNDFILEADFSIKNSLIIRSYTGDVDAPDTYHINYSNKPILPGTSIAGSVRSRADKIIRTLVDYSGEEPHPIIKNLFGWAETDKNTKEKIKSRIYFDENFILNTSVQVQNRIKIDRFTGGTMNTALFEEAALWPYGEHGNITTRIIIKDCETYEAGLILLTIKDLCNSDLPIGGGKSIGRGFLIGRQVSINYKGNSFRLSQGSNKIDLEGDRRILESYVVDLINKINEAGEKHGAY